MEDALARVLKDKRAAGVCLNPCCNGRCTRTLKNGGKERKKDVLILVVMEDALALYFKEEGKWKKKVLILVVMEDALALKFTNHGRNDGRSS